MDKVIGNYLTQENRDFPLDCETLEAIQTNMALLGMLGNIAGDCVILRGCELSQDGASRSEGYVFVRTSAFPGGEVLRFEGGAVGGGMYLRQEDVCVTAQGYEYPKAYTRRSLAPGVGAENFDWNDFREIKTFADLAARISDLADSLKQESARFAPPPLGVVQMWAGARVPDGYALCDGRELRTEEYPELYKALGVVFNMAYSANGTRYSTSAGFFRLPDLRGRFVVGYHDSDNDYKSMGVAGGEKKHRLSSDEMPEHSHRFKDYYYPEKGNYKNVVDQPRDFLNINGNVGSAGTDTDNDALLYYFHDTNKMGGGAAHENRPPYYVLAYIMRLK